MLGGVIRFKIPKMLWAVEVYMSLWTKEKWVRGLRFQGNMQFTGS